MNSNHTLPRTPLNEPGARWSRGGRGFAEASAFLAEFETRIQAADEHLAKTAAKQRQCSPEALETAA